MTAAEAFLSDVSRETMQRLEAYVDLLKRWNTSVNLVSPGSLPQVWRRHIADSAQLLSLAPTTARHWVDLGAGGGLPGVPVAILASEALPGLRVTLIESDQRKSVFLQETARVLDLPITIRARRIETLPLMNCDVVSARALAPLGKLCALAYELTRASMPRPVYLFPKGRTLDSELTDASTHWHIRADRIASRTNTEAAILRILELEPRI